MSKHKILFLGFIKDSNGDFNRIKGALNNRWHLESIEDPETLDKRIEELKVDVIICKGNSPHQNELEYLKQVSEHCAGAIRILIADPNDKDVMMKAAEYAHRIVPPTIDADALENMLNNSLSLHGLLANPEIRNRISSIKSLPSSPELYKQITIELSSKNASIKTISDLVSQDISITTKLLQLVNSAYFGLQNQVDSTFNAINFLGLDTVKSIVFAAGVFEQFNVPNILGYSIESIYNNSINVAAKARLIAQVLATDTINKDNILMAGLLHDVGKLMMLGFFQKELKEVVNLTIEKKINFYQAQKEIMGTSDAEIGAYLLSLWGIPDPILEAIAYHYKPSIIEKPEINLLTLIHLAYAISRDEKDKVKDENNSAVDIKYLSSIGLYDYLQNLRTLCPGAVV